MRSVRVKRRVVQKGRYKAWRERYHLKPLISVVFNLIIPLVSIYLIMSQYPLLAKERFYRMIVWIVPFGAALFIVSLVQERYGKGTKVRLGLDALFVGLTMGWLFGFLGGRTIVNNDYGGWDFTVDVGPVVAIALCGTSLNFVHDVLEYLAHKDFAKGPMPEVRPIKAAVRKDHEKGPGKEKGNANLRFG